jgi:hypothetical protein
LLAAGAVAVVGVAALAVILVNQRQPAPVAATPPVASAPAPQAATALVDPSPVPAAVAETPTASPAPVRLASSAGRTARRTAHPPQAVAIPETPAQPVEAGAPVVSVPAPVVLAPRPAVPRKTVPADPSAPIPTRPTYSE